MGRPQPNILLTTFQNTHKELQVLSAENYYYVVYKNEPFNILQIDRDPRKWQARKRYLTNGWAHRGHATNLANKLNKLYASTEFTVREIKGE